MNHGLDRRTFLKRGGMLAGGVAVLGQSGLLAACGSSSNSGTAVAATDTLRFAFLADMQVPDPDIFYEGEGLGVTLSVYDGLLSYKPDKSDFAPGLAEAWEVSADGLTYTFHLRSGVTYHDGTAMQASDFIASFDRRTKVNQGPAYMLADVASTTAPDASTLVVKLKHPVDPFLHYLACPWSPKGVSPALIKSKAVGDDLAQQWLQTNDAGTGPYTIKEFVPSSHYTLVAYDGYWGPKPEFTTIDIQIIPDVTTQRLKLEAGDLDLVTKGLPIGDVESLSKNSKVTVTRYPVATKTALYFNATSGMFADKALRQAVREALDVPALIEPSYGDTATVSTQFYPVGFYPDGVAPDSPTKDTSKLEALVKKLESKKVDLAVDEQGGATDRRVAELIQTQLQALGLDVTVRGMPTSQTFAMSGQPDAPRPDLLLNVAGGDALHADAEVRIFFRTGAQPLNWYNYSDPAIDAAMDAGLSSPNTEEATKHYAECASLIVDQAWLVNLADIEDVVITSAGVTNVVHDLAAGHTVRLGELKKKA